MPRVALAGLLIALIGMAPRPCAAGYISELYLADTGAGAGGLPDAVELRGLPAASDGPVELVIVDAGPTRLGKVKQTITIPTPTDGGTQLITDGPWPSDLWDGAPTTGINQVTLASLGEAGGFDLRFARSLLLYDRPTGVTRYTRLTLSEQGVGEAERLGALTLAIGGNAAHGEAAGPVVSMSRGEAMVRPLTPALDLGVPHAGRIDGQGALRHSSPALKLTPGEDNPVWSGTVMPTPATVGLVGAGAILLLGARPPRRHCSTGRWRL